MCLGSMRDILIPQCVLLCQCYNWCDSPHGISILHQLYLLNIVVAWFILVCMVWMNTQF